MRPSSSVLPANALSAIDYVLSHRRGLGERTHEVIMKMINYLCPSAVNDDTIPGICQIILQNKLIYHLRNFPMKRYIMYRGKFSNMFLRYNQQMHRLYGMDIRKHHEVFIFIDKFFWDFFARNFAKNTILHMAYGIWLIEEKINHKLYAIGYRHSNTF